MVKEPLMSSELRANMTRRATWQRLLFMMLFGVIYTLAELVLVAVVSFQFGVILITTRKNDRLLDFGARLSFFLYQVLLFITYANDDKPFPFSNWPTGGGPHSEA